LDQPFHHLVRGIFIKDNKVLLTKARGYINTFLPGGHIEFGESAKAALVREVEEELGISCKVGRFLGLVEHKWEEHGRLNCEINQLFEVESEELHNSPNPPDAREPHLEFFWCDGEDLEPSELEPYPLKPLIKNYLTGKKEIWWASTLND
jgi:8-oxo-dGTP diphosphatase